MNFSTKLQLVSQRIVNWIKAIFRRNNKPISSAPLQAMSAGRGGRSSMEEQGRKADIENAKSAHDELSNLLNELEDVDRKAPDAESGVDSISSHGSEGDLTAREVVARLLRERERQSVPGTMELHHHINARTRSRAIRRPSGATDIGTDPQLWDRWTSDRQVFQRRRAGGALLIDCSGSMAWDWSRLERALREFPALTIGVYSGDAGNGRLCILARDGRLAPFDSEDMMYGNEVDIEALEWLAKQKGPRMWLSDGEVTGGQVDALGTRRAFERIQQITLRGQIARTMNLGATIKFFRTGGERQVEGVFGPHDEEFLGEHFHWRREAEDRMTAADTPRVVSRDIGLEP